MTAANASTRRCRRSIRSVRSTTSVRTTKIAPASAVADRRVRERLRALVEDVLRDAQVQRPEQDRREQHELDGRGPTHGLTLSAPSVASATDAGLRRRLGATPIVAKLRALVRRRRLGVDSLRGQRPHEQAVAALAVRCEPTRSRPSDRGVELGRPDARAAPRRSTRAPEARSPRADDALHDRTGRVLTRQERPPNDAERDRSGPRTPPERRAGTAASARWIASDAALASTHASGSDESHVAAARRTVCRSPSDSLDMRSRATGRRRGARRQGRRRRRPSYAARCRWTMRDVSEWRRPSCGREAGSDRRPRCRRMTSSPQS